MFARNSESPVAQARSEHSLPARRRELLRVGGLCVIGALIGIPSIRPLFERASPSILDLDPSWHMGIAAAIAQNLQWGPQFVFTYGPLGFLHLSMIYPTTILTVIAALLPAVLYVCYPIVMLLFADFVRRAAHVSSRGETLAILMGTALVALWTDVATQAVEGPELLCLVGLAWCLLRPTSRAVPYLAAGTGVILAFEALFKVDQLDVAVAELLILTLGAWLVPGRPFRVVGFAWVGLTLGYLALWVACGQALSNLLSFWIGSWEMSSGYSAAMSLASDWQPVVAVGLLALAGVGLPVVFRSWRRWHLSIQEVVIGLSLPWLYVSWEDGLVRMGTGFSNERVLALLAAIMGVAWLVLLMSPNLRSRFAIGPAITCCLCAVVVLSVFNPTEYDSWILNDLAHIPTSTSTASGSGPDYIPASVVAALRGHTVNALPRDISFVIDNHLTWDPLPEAQTFTAYTAYLDRLDAAQLASPQGASRLLISLGDIDDRYLLWDPPDVWNTVISRYRCLTVTGLSVVAARATPRIGPYRTLGSRSTSLGTWVPVPKTNLSYEFADVRIGTSLEGKVLGLVLRQTPIFAMLRLSNGAVVGPTRFTAATAGDGVYLSHYVATSRQLCDVLSGRSSHIAKIVSIKFITPQPGEWARSIVIRFVGAS